MMSLTKLGPSGWRYFAEEIATGREDYFARSAEHPGRYLGRGADAMGLAGAEVDEFGLERLIGHGTDPRDGAAMGRGLSPDNDNVVAGFGLTFSPPKSVSVLWGTGGEELRTVVVAARRPRSCEHARFPAGPRRLHPTRRGRGLPGRHRGLRGREVPPPVVSGRAVLQLAAYRSRAPKLEVETPTEVLVARWREEAASFGQAPEHWLPRVLGRTLTSTSEDREAVVHLAIARLEETRATWGRSDVTGVLTTLVTGTNADELRARVEQAADEVIGDHRVCSLAAPLPAEPPDALRRRDGMSAIERHGATRYTTEATLRSEARVLDAVAKGRNARVGLVPERTLDMVLSGSMLGADQQRAVRELLGGGEQVALLVGPAGAGSPAGFTRRARLSRPPATVRSGSRPRRSRRACCPTRRDLVPTPWPASSSTWRTGVAPSVTGT